MPGDRRSQRRKGGLKPGDRDRKPGRDWRVGEDDGKITKSSGGVRREGNESRGPFRLQLVLPVWGTKLVGPTGSFLENSPSYPTFRQSSAQNALTRSLRIRITWIEQLYGILPKSL